MSLKIYTIVILFILSEIIFGQNPIGLTKNVTELSNGSWEINADNIQNAGETGGALFIDNHPYIGLDKSQS